jgi:hypothetical protein
VLPEAPLANSGQSNIRSATFRTAAWLSAAVRSLEWDTSRYISSMRATMCSILVALATVSRVASAYSAAPAADDKKLTPQQEKMKTCNAEAGDKKGDERKAFMSSWRGRQGGNV